MNNNSLSNPQIQKAPFENDEDFLNQIFTETPPSDAGGFHPFAAAGGHFTDDSAAHIMMMPLSLGSERSQNGHGVDGSVQTLYNGFAAGSLHGGAAQPQSTANQRHQLQNQQVQAQSQGSASTTVPTPPAQIKPKVRARRGQATDPHSIAERLRRERIAERMKALQELVPNADKTDKASMLDEIIDYVKFLQLQVKVLSMSRLGGAAAVAPLLSERGVDCGQASGIHAPPGTDADGNPTDNNQTMTEQQVVKLMEEDMGSAMQYLQGKGLCLMPISIATAISTAGTCRSRNPLINGGDGPTSPNASVMTVQSTVVINGNGVEGSSVKNAVSTP